jgi:transposase
MTQKKNTTVQMPVLRSDAAGIDIGARSSFVALPPDREQPVREFSSFTTDIHALADWLIQHGITTVAMESTGVYWIPFFQVLETRGLEVFLVNAHHVNSVAGRPKTDVQDCQWIQHMHSLGLLKASFRPTDLIVAMRTLTRHRDNLVAQTTQAIQHMQKSMTQMNLQLHHVISDISGVTGLAIIDSILVGQRDPENLAKLKDRRIKASQATIVKALQGDYRDEHLLTLRQSREQYNFIQNQVADCDKAIIELAQKFNDERCNEAGPSKERTNTQKKLRLRSSRDTFIHAEMRKAFGIDLFELPGFATDTVLRVFSEVGTDFSKFRSEDAFANWLALCPNNKITGGKIKSTRTRQSKSRLAAALRQAAYSLASSKSYYGALYRRLRAKFGAPKAVTAIANRLAKLLYHLVTTGQEFNESKFAEAEQKHREYKQRSLERQAFLLGFQLVPKPQ